MSILSGREIVRQVELGHIGIDPFVREHVNPASVDLTLGNKVVTYENRFGDSEYRVVYDVHEAWEERGVLEKREIDDTGFVIWPCKLYLMHTAERVWTEKFVPVLDGKSSIGRLGVMVHLTAGYGDPGYRGEYTLEVVTFRAVRLYAGMRICQMRFHEMVGEAENYQARGHYAGEQRGPVASMVHKQFEKK